MKTDRPNRNRQNRKAQNSISRAAVVACAAFGALHASAGTLGALSARHYVQDGLVLHFDGIENAGAGLAHSDAAAVWKDLSQSGNDVSFEATSTTVAADRQSGWTENGYYFNGNACGITESEMNIAPNRITTVQTVTTFVPSEQKRSYPAPFGTSSDFCNLYTYGKGASLQFKILNIGGNNAVVSPWEGRYASAVMYSGNKWVFQTATPSVTFAAGSSTVEVGNRYWRIGAAGTGAGDTAQRAMVGTVHSVRAYDRILTNADFTWNRIIDDYRFFGILTNSLPTNAVVVASAVDGLEGREPNGMYIPSEWTFTMSDTSSTNMVGDKGYSFAGYVLETWDASTGTWTNPVTNLTDSTWTSPANDVPWASRRITWIWKVVRGIVAVPDVDAYVQDGLVLHLDGIRNVGADAPHNSSAATWKDLVGGKIANFTQIEDDSSAWTDDGYFFGGRSLAKMDTAINLLTTVTVQVACSVDASAQRDLYPRLVGTYTTGDWLALYLMPGSSLLRFKDNDVIAGELPLSSWGGSYLTATVTDESHAFFETAAPASLISNTRTYSVGGDRIVTIGGARGNNATILYTNCFLVGEIKNVRIYNRPLDNAEFEVNRAVDEARRGRIPNVEVAVTAYGGSVEAPGLYEVQGEWTFSATNVVDKSGIARAVTGYRLETAQNGVWSAPVEYSGASYTYKLGKSPAQVRLTWKLISGMRILLR